MLSPVQLQQSILWTATAVSVAAFKSGVIAGAVGRLALAALLLSASNSTRLPVSLPVHLCGSASEPPNTVAPADQSHPADQLSVPCCARTSSEHAYSACCPNFPVADGTLFTFGSCASYSLGMNCSSGHSFRYTTLPGVVNGTVTSVAMNDVLTAVVIGTPDQCDVSETSCVLDQIVVTAQVVAFGHSETAPHLRSVRHRGSMPTLHSTAVFSINPV